MFNLSQFSLRAAPVRVVFIGVIAALFTLVTPVTAYSQGRKQTSVIATANVPLVEALPETAQTQIKGGISITLAPVPFELERGPGCSYGFVTGLQQYLIVPRGVLPTTHERVNETRYDALTVTPDSLSFLLTIRNQMNRVFRGAGAVVQFNVGGRVQGIDQSRYADLLETLIPPQGQIEIRMLGPNVDSVTSGTLPATLGVFLSDVVVKIDNAGSIVARDNFEWYFTVRSNQVSETVPAATRRVWIPNAAAMTIMSVSPDGSARMLPRGKPTCIPGAIAG